MNTPPKGISVKKKFWAIMVLAAIGMTITVMVSLLALKGNLLDDRKVKTRHVVESAYSILEYFNDQAVSGLISQEVAQQSAKKTIESLRYEEKDYFWINDMQPVMVMHPIKPELNGKGLSGFKDPSGKKYLSPLSMRSRKMALDLLTIFGPSRVLMSRLPKSPMSKVSSHGAGLSVRGSILMM